MPATLCLAQLVLILAAAAAASAQTASDKPSTVGSRLRDRIDAIQDGLVERYGSNLLNTCPHAPTRLATLNCTGCSWDRLSGDPDMNSCSVENVIGFYLKAAVSSWIFACLVLGSLVTLLAVPHRSVLTDKPRHSSRRLKTSVRKDLARLWVFLFLGNWLQAFILTYLVLCEPSVAAQVHDATVLTIQIGLLLYTLFFFFWPTGRLRHHEMMMHQNKTAMGFGIAIIAVLLSMVFASWLLARRFADSAKIFISLKGRYDDDHYNLCYLNTFYRHAQATTAVQYLKGILQLVSALIFLLGGFSNTWLAARIVNIALVYALTIAQFYYGRPVMRITSPVNIIAEALAFDFVELSVAHLLVWLGIMELYEERRLKGDETKHEHDEQNDEGGPSPSTHSGHESDQPV